MTNRLASCGCGQLSARVTGEPVRVSICHCLDCQRRTGGPFGQQARFARDAVTTAGRSSTWERTGDGGSTATFHFCPRCGSTLWWEADSLPGWVTMPVGAFADPAFPAPGVSVYEERRHSWVQPPPGAERHD